MKTLYYRGVFVLSQNKTSSSNIGIPDYSKAIYINWYGYTYYDSPSSVTIRYFINGTKIYGDTPIPVRKGDVISAYNPYYKNATEAAMEFAPNT